MSKNIFFAEGSYCATPDDRVSCSGSQDSAPHDKLGSSLGYSVTPKETVTVSFIQAALRSGVAVQASNMSDVQSTHSAPGGQVFA